MRSPPAALMDFGRSPVELPVALVRLNARSASTSARKGRQERPWRHRPLSTANRRRSERPHGERHVAVPALLRRRLFAVLISSPKVDSFGSMAVVQSYLSQSLTDGVALPKAIGPNTIQIVIQTFIPMATVDSPYGTFSGDGRELADEPFLIGQSYRIRQRVAFDPDDPTWGFHH